MHSSPISGFDLTQNLSLKKIKYLLQLLLAPICQSFFFNTTRANHHVDLVSHPVSPRNHSFCVSFSCFSKNMHGDFGGELCGADLPRTVIG
jgi:hypothetical protein